MYTREHLEQNVNFSLCTGVHPRKPGERGRNPPITPALISAGPRATPPTSGDAAFPVGLRRPSCQPFSGWSRRFWALPHWNPLPLPYPCLSPFLFLFSGCLLLRSLFLSCSHPPAERVVAPRAPECRHTRSQQTSGLLQGDLLKMVVVMPFLNQ